MKNTDKQFLLNDSKTFCMAPWVHLYTSPVGEASPCCIARKEVGKTITNSVEDLMNSDTMKELRVDMLNERFNTACQTCHSHEQQGMHSFRNQFNTRFGKHFDESLLDTKEDGHINNFKMRYYDIRFSNICNMKCRTCNSHFSSQWEQENIKRGVPYGRIPVKNNHPDLVASVVDHIPHMEYAYFAGGEPLITEEHYILLEEMIRRNRTDIKLVYNSNVSSLKFKDKDILKIWSKFTNPIELSASIDHIGKKAEYIRHGTVWDTVDSNLRLLKSASNVTLLINSVGSLFNYVSLPEMYDYLIGSKIYKPGNSFNLYPLSTPEIFHTQALPRDLKEQGRTNITKLITSMEDKGFTSSQVGVVKNLMSWTEAADSWDNVKDKFKVEVTEIDRVRGENFVETFPELASLFD